MAADSIGESKKPTMGSSLFFVGWKGMAEKIFVVISYSPWVGELGKLNI